MGYVFRLRFRLSEGAFIDIDESSTALKETTDEVVSLHAVGSGPIRSTRDLVVKGQPYSDEETARQRGEQWRHTMVQALASIQVGADFGERGSLGWVNTKFFSDRTGERVLQDSLGVTVYEEEPRPHFIGGGTATLSVGKNRETVMTAIRDARDGDRLLSDPVQIAYSLFSASASQQEIEARFMLLMMALETMLDQHDRSPEVRDHVEHLCGLTKDAGSLSDSQRTSLVQAIGALKKESIGESGRRAVAGFSGTEYGGTTPQRFFSKCYKLRSRLVHGAVPRPRREDLNSVITELERLVADMIVSMPKS